jgi:hypothetical protein
MRQVSNIAEPKDKVAPPLSKAADGAINDIYGQSMTFTAQS